MTNGLLNNIGLLALLAICISFLRISQYFQEKTLLSKFLIGAVFGTTAAIVMSQPIALPQGAIFDTRGGPAMLVGIYGGPVSAIIASIIGAVARYQVGGASAVGGASSFLFYGLSGLAGLYYLRRSERQPNLTFFIGLAAVGSMAVLPSFFIGQSVETGLSILKNAWWMLLVGNIAGVSLLGLMLQMDVRRHLKNQALKHAKQAAETASLAKSEFLSALSHELRTPLNHIIGFGQLLLTDNQAPLSSDQKKTVEHIVSGGEYQLNMIKRILEYSDESIITPDPGKAFNPKEEINSSIQPIRDQVDKHGCQVEFIVNDNVPNQFFGNADAFRLILDEALSNAVKFMDNPNGKITVEARMNADVLHINIIDNGPGIPTESREIVFQPLERLNSNEMAIEGVGIGLALRAKKRNKWVVASGLTSPPPAPVSRSLCPTASRHPNCQAGFSHPQARIAAKHGEKYLPLVIEYTNHIRHLPPEPIKKTLIPQKWGLFCRLPDVAQWFY